MKGSVLANQVILNKGERVAYIYKLTRGSVHILDSKNHVVFQVPAPSYLNIIQSIYNVPILKTIRASSHCQIQQLKWRDSCKKIIKKMKDRGLRKSRFAVFEAISSPYFYQLMLYGKEVELKRGQHLLTQVQSIYLIVEDAIVISRDKKGPKLLRLGEGEMLTVGQQQQIIQCDQNRARIMHLPISVVQAIFGGQFRKIMEISKIQKDTIEHYFQRNERVTLDLKQFKQKSYPKPVLPQQFQNEVNQKWEQLTKCSRVRSSFSACDLQRNREHIIKENKVMFKALIDLNRKQYGKEYAYNKRLEVSRRVNSLVTTNHNIASIYERSSIKQQFAIIKHPIFHKPKKVMMDNKADFSTSGLRKVKNQFDITRKLFVSCVRLKEGSDQSKFQKEGVNV